MTTAHIKKVIKIGGSFAIVLPSEWAKGKLKAGEEMVVVGNDGLHIFRVREKSRQEEHETESESNE